MLPFAIILAGSGRADGSEIHESVSVLVHLARCGARYQCFAPAIPQADVVDHLTGQTTRETRDCLVEAARIARGDIQDLARCAASDYAGLVVPGGFGAAKNLCTYAKDGPSCVVQAEVARVLRAFKDAGKPIGLICIAPVLAAAVFGRDMGQACSITLGATIASGNRPAMHAEAMGMRHVERPSTRALVDNGERVVTTPAYMCDANPFEVFTGIGELVDELVAMAG